MLKTPEAVVAATPEQLPQLLDLLRLHLSAQKPTLDPRVGDEIVKLIIQSRSGGMPEIPPAVPPHQQRFQEAWTTTIAAITPAANLAQVRQRFLQAFDTDFDAKSAVIVQRVRFMLRLVDEHAPSEHLHLQYQQVVKLVQSLQAQQRPASAKWAICALFSHYLEFLKGRYEAAYLSGAPDQDKPQPGPSGGGFGDDIPKWIYAF